VAAPPDSDGCGYARRLPATRRPAANKLLVPAEVLPLQAGLAFVILLHEALDAPVSMAMPAAAFSSNHRELAGLVTAPCRVKRLSAAGPRVGRNCQAVST
jgi:hypothetical protein